MSLYVIKLLLGGESEFMEKKTPYSDRSKTEKCIKMLQILTGRYIKCNNLVNCIDESTKIG